MRWTIALLLLITGCSFLKRTPNQFYSLETSAPAQTAGASVPRGGAPIAVDGIELPPGLDRRGMVVRGADHKIEVRGTHQWTAPLEEMVIHTLAFDLANRLPDGMVVLPGQAQPPGAKRSISVVFEDLAPGPDAVFVLDARWTLAGITHREHITVPMASMESPQIAAAMSAALGQLADRIVAGL